MEEFYSKPIFKLISSKLVLNQSHHFLADLIEDNNKTAVKINNFGHPNRAYLKRSFMKSRHLSKIVSGKIKCFTNTKKRN